MEVARDYIYPEIFRYKIHLKYNMFISMNISFLLIVVTLVGSQFSLFHMVSVSLSVVVGVDQFNLSLQINNSVLGMEASFILLLNTPSRDQGAGCAVSVS